MEKQWLNLFLRVTVMVASIYMSITLSGINPIFTSIFAALAVIEIAKIAHTISSLMWDRQVDALVELSDTPIRIVFLSATFMSNIGGLAGFTVKGLALLIGVSWLLWYHRQEDIQDRTLS